MHDAPLLLNLIPLEPLARAQLRAAGLDIHDVDVTASGLAGRGTAGKSDISGLASRARLLLTNGTTGLNAAQMDLLPQLELVCAFGAGYERIDVAAATQRGIAVAHAPNTNGQTVADHALALMLAVSRGLVTLDRAVKAGGWAKHRAPRPTLHGARLGVIGLGNIGQAIARRAEGFGMSVGYHTRTPHDDRRWQYFANVAELADASDFLVLACPGGPSTHHLVDADVLARLGANGFLVNVARGSVVDTEALIEALCDGVIAGAALDVFETEPEVPSALRMLENVVLTPHVSGRSPAALQAQIDSVLANVRAHLAGQPLPTPVNSTTQTGAKSGREASR
ncbi:hydroxyacid dehydrogenase [Pandoraea captiosa]|jgi:lactate dehydrogenase-like 2-hydroxyacid dehydrogenase|uniref:Hydroxyacid dehydrogenase n=1 Tax=Pandoraea captiosa TaxID=2508302 RepID=A0A5E4ZM85_9BURK|nr:2-hydroxyacid dehydrogenase [Pandoraea captiosa]VVE61767.1 hydroxyacid dehydrogenase [Pandoraea captiosa]